MLWYYADLEKQACMDDMRANNGTVNMQPIGGRKSSKVGRLEKLSRLNCDMW